MVREYADAHLLAWGLGMQALPRGLQAYHGPFRHQRSPHRRTGIRGPSPCSSATLGFCLRQPSGTDTHVVLIRGKVSIGKSVGSPDAYIVLPEGAAEYVALDPMPRTTAKSRALAGICKLKSMVVWTNKAAALPIHASRTERR